MESCIIDQSHNTRSIALLMKGSGDFDPERSNKFTFLYFIVILLVEEVIILLT